MVLEEVTLTDSRGRSATIPKDLEGRPFYSRLIKTVPKGDWRFFTFAGKRFPIAGLAQFVENILGDRYCWERLITRKYRAGVNIGAEKGYTTILMSKFCEKTLSLEPLAKEYETLLNTCEILGDNNLCRNTGVSDEKIRSPHQYYYSHDSQQAPKEEDASFEPLDELVERCDFIKMDAYGMELKAIKGMKRLLEENKIDVFIAKYKNRGLLEENLQIEFAAHGYYLVDRGHYHYFFSKN